jgi:hypothetical protein
LTQKLPEQTLEEAILKATSEQKPETVNQLAQQIHDQYPSISEKEILDAILKLQNEDKLHFTQKQPSPTNPTTYLRSNSASWYWITLALTFAAVVSVYTISEDAFPLVIIRYILGALFILWLPGYAFIKALFPVQLPLKTSDRNLDIIERVALSSGMSLALVPIVGLLLNYTPWGIRLTPITLSLTALTLTFATAATIREYQSKKPAD